MAGRAAWARRAWRGKTQPYVQMSTLVSLVKTNFGALFSLSLQSTIILQLMVPVADYLHTMILTSQLQA